MTGTYRVIYTRIECFARNESVDYKPRYLVFDRGPEGLEFTSQLRILLVLITKSLGSLDAEFNDPTLRTDPLYHPRLIPDLHAFICAIHEK